MKIERNSSFELLRIILILLILIEHGNMWFIGSGYHSSSEHIAKCVVESVCIGAVNAFVLISGWFGIKNGMAKIGKLCFTLLFCTIPALLIAIGCGLYSLYSLLSPDMIYEYVFGGPGYWFVIAYIGLVIVSPMLNMVIESISASSFRHILIASYILIFVFDFAFKTAVTGTEGGYSVVWFIYLYLLAAYIRRYDIQTFNKYPLIILVISVAFQSVFFYYGLIGLRYTNPLILVEAICVISIFSKYEFHNRIINYISGGCLMAYLLHMQPICIPYIRSFLIGEYRTLGYWQYMVEISLFAVGVMIISAFLNKVLSWGYKALSTKLFRFILKQLQ